MRNLKRNIFVLLPVLLAASPAAAQAPDAEPGAPTAAPPASAPTDTVVRAKALFTGGQQAYSQGDYPGALKSFTSALNLVRRPSILFNIAQCHRQLGAREKALTFYEAHLQAWERQHPGQGSPHHDEIQGHILRLRAELARAKEQQRRKALQKELKAKEAARAAERATQREELNLKLKAQRRRKTIMGYSGLGLGAAFAVTAAVLYGVGISAGDEAHAAYMAAQDEEAIRGHRADIEASKDKVIAGHVFIGLAAAAAAYGVFELVTRPSVQGVGGEQEQRVSLGAGPVVGGGGVLLRGQF